ncbi:MAG: restriction endonuclease subunit S [Halobacteriovoraceae bacterium]|nr:restriction endonuclease subunit S [Halobacteriovoraceae bacterium]
MTKNNVPEVRNKEFVDSWEFKHLSGEVDFYSGLTYSPLNVVKEGGTLVLRSSNVQEGEISLNDNVFVRSDVVNSSNVEVGDVIVVVRNGSRNLIGKHAQIKEDMRDTVIGAFMAGLRPRQSSFINALLDTQLFSKEVEKNLGATINQITSGMFKEMKFMFPVEGEQKKVGIFFKNIDRLISQHSKKYEKMLNVKKSMLEKMFPKDGTTIPEIRFKGFSKEWKLKSFSEISESFGYGLNAAAVKYDGVNKYIRITDIDDVTRKFLDKDITSPKTDMSKANDYILRSGDLLFARTGASVGKTYLYRKEDGLVYFAGFLIRARIKPDFDPEFVFQNTLTNRYLNYIRITSQRSGQPGVNAQEYSEFSILTPTQDEQEKIGCYFKHLDGLISLQAEELEKLKNIKKAMLEKMFV